tara:strand:- start:49 stop:435 length:387 start_codon:yes stop_codon:yes gene_type:complete
MEKFLYFRTDSTLANDDDAAGSVTYPLSKLQGIVAGDVATSGVITESDVALSLAFTPMMIQEGSDTQLVDVVVLTCGTNKAKDVQRAIVQAINGGPHSDGFITIFDAVTGVTVDSNLTAIHVVDMNVN